MVLLQGIRDEEQFVLEAKGAGVGHPLDQEVAGVLERRQVLGKRARGGGVAGAGRSPAQKLVGPLVVVQRPEAIEGTLLGGEIGARGRQAPALRVRCMRSCAPFSWGEAG